MLHILAFVEGDMQAQSLYSALAIRMVQLLDLPRRLSDDYIQRETEIRSKLPGFDNLVSTEAYMYSPCSLVDNLVHGQLVSSRLRHPEAAFLRT